jgi:penicillin-binding protein 1A
MTRVHAADGALLGEYSKERRLYLPIQAIPKLAINAFLAAEDKNFYEHGGIDYQGMARAALLYVRNFGSNRRPQGASTITQQVVKNFFFSSEVSFTRKINEALLAMRLERTYSKDKILELYLNEIPLGLGAYGIAAASLVYFDKPVNELTVAEASYLAALPKAPSALHPVRNRDRAIERRNDVIDRLLENGWITQADADTAPQGSADCNQTEQYRAHFRRQVLRRGGPPRFVRALRREETLRRRSLGTNHAGPEAAGDGAKDHGGRPRHL